MCERERGRERGPASSAGVFPKIHFIFRTCKVSGREDERQQINRKAALFPLILLSVVLRAPGRAVLPAGWDAGSSLCGQAGGMGQAGRSVIWAGGFLCISGSLGPVYKVPPGSFCNIPATREPSSSAWQPEPSARPMSHRSWLTVQLGSLLSPQGINLLFPHRD